MCVWWHRGVMILCGIFLRNDAEILRRCIVSVLTLERIRISMFALLAGCAGAQVLRAYTVLLWLP